MLRLQKLSSWIVRIAALAGLLAVPPAWAASTSLEIYGVLFDGSGNRINANFVEASSSIFGSATGGTPLAQFATENVQVSNGSFLQIFSVDDSIFAGDAYLEMTINGFTMAPRLGVFYNLSYYAASGVTAGPVGNPIFELYAGTAAPPPVPEPGTFAMLASGLAVLSLRLGRASRGS